MQKRVLKSLHAECVPPVAPVNGYVGISGTVPGSVARYSSDYGYAISGSDVRTCHGVGT